MEIPPGAGSGPEIAPQRGSDTVHTRLDAALAHRWIHELDRRLRASEVRLTELDAAIGDADHGANMTRGARAAAARLADGVDTSAAQLITAVGHTFSRSIGGASGPLYGTWFTALGRTLPSDHDADAGEFAEALLAALVAVQQLGAAERGDKTMVDALGPAADRAQSAARAGADLAGTLRLAVGAAEDGALATVPLRARRGRASYLGARSEGHQDPGATSAAIVLDALRRAAGA
ncbi:MAG: dihydroxyacetone kinase subunit DhaL [Nitriliruptoraceae bacterium]